MRKTHGQKNTDRGYPLKNLYEAVEGCLSVEVQAPKSTSTDKVLEIAV